MRRFLLILMIVGIGLVNIAASGTSEQNAIAIASVAGFVLTFLYKFLPQAGHYMVAITVAVSILAALGAMVASGELSLSHVDVSSLYVTAMSAYGISQLVYATLTQSPKTVNAVT